MTLALKFSVKSGLPSSQVFNCSQRKSMRHACVSHDGMLLTGSRRSIRRECDRAGIGAKHSGSATDASLPSLKTYTESTVTHSAHASLQFTTNECSLLQINNT